MTSCWFLPYHTNAMTNTCTYSQSLFLGEQDTIILHAMHGNNVQLFAVSVESTTGETIFKPHENEQKIQLKQRLKKEVDI